MGFFSSCKLGTWPVYYAPFPTCYNVSLQAGNWRTFLKLNVSFQKLQNSRQQFYTLLCQKPKAGEVDHWLQGVRPSLSISLIPLLTKDNSYFLSELQRPEGKWTPTAWKLCIIVPTYRQLKVNLKYSLPGGYCNPDNGTHGRLFNSVFFLACSGEIKAIF